MSTLAELKAKFRALWPFLDERTRRLTAASEAKALGYGGISLVRRACGLSRKAIRKGVREIEAEVTWKGRIRRPGRRAQTDYRVRPAPGGATGGDD